MLSYEYWDTVETDILASKQWNNMYVFKLNIKNNKNIINNYI